jgi:hypothetical protein
MPCKSDYLEPSPRECAYQRTAQLLVYVLDKLGRRVSAEIRHTAGNVYAGVDLAPQLCELLNNMREDERDALVYNARDKNARDLADWWEEHQARDQMRQDLEREEAEKETLIKNAIAKLTTAERKALGLE